MGKLARFLLLLVVISWKGYVLQVRSVGVTLPDSLLFISTLDGSLHAVSKQSGDIKWTLKEDPIIQVPVYLTEPGFLPDPNDGSLYILGGKHKEGLMKLPFTIPELVQSSPCRSSDGILYTGTPQTERKQTSLSTSSSDSICPNTPLLYIGRTEYMITMYDTKTQELRWNATYNDYSAPPYDEKHDYKMAHLVSSGDGLVVTVDRESGKLNSHLYASTSLVHHGVSLVPRGLTLARIEGPETEEVTVRERGECEITPSTDVRYPQGSTHTLNNQWLLIGHHELPPVAHTTMLRDFPGNLQRSGDAVIQPWSQNTRPYTDHPFQSDRALAEVRGAVPGTSRE
ncbi:hypothetical protein UPYG_G00056960 [Umbra pygmaea]|uniref:Uncharacterized protein n=1 Tax=Umbra pygmaea TaxID=75934 RepID=A0ABD0X8F7_UMBPY